MNIMGKVKSIIILVVVAAAFGAGVYFRDEAVRFYDGMTKEFQGFEKTEIGSIISQVGKQILAPTPLNIGGKASNIVLLKSKIITETNLQRQENGNFSALKENTKLNQAAVVKANDMFVNQYFEHVSPAGVDPGKLVKNSGYDYILAGENLILGNFSSESELVQKWMDSPGHRANILNNRYTEIGVAIVKGTYKGETVWIGVQEFGLPLSTCSQPSADLKNQIDSVKPQLDYLSLQINEKKDQLEGINSRSAVYSQMVEDYNQLVEQYNVLAEQLKSIIATYNNQVNIFNNCAAGE